MTRTLHELPNVHKTTMLVTAPPPPKLKALSVMLKTSESEENKHAAHVTAVVTS